MKNCPDCGAELLDQNASICPRCGKHFTESGRPSKKTAKGNAASASPDGKKKCKRKKLKKRKKLVPHTQNAAVDDGYDGYYDDVLPPDLDRVQEGMDRELVRKIVLLVLSVVLVIGCCIAMLCFL